MPQIPAKAQSDKISPDVFLLAHSTEAESDYHQGHEATHGNVQNSSESSRRLRIGTFEPVKNEREATLTLAPSPAPRRSHPATANLTVA